jgi:hypothetical protein
LYQPRERSRFSFTNDSNSESDVKIPDCINDVVTTKLAIRFLTKKLEEFELEHNRRLYNQLDKEWSEFLTIVDEQRASTLN